MRQLPFQLLAPRVELDHPVFDLLRGHARDDRIHQLLMIPFCAGQCLFLFLAVPGGCRLQPVALGCVFFAEDLHRVRIHQVVRQCIQHPGFQVGLLDRALVAADRRALVPRRGTAEAVPGDLGKAAAAAAAGHQAGKQGLGPAAVPDRHSGARGLQFALAAADCFPELLIDDPQMGDFGDGPLAFGVKARDALTGLGILHVAQPVPDLPADIEFIIQDASAALAVAVNGGSAPVAAGRGGNTFLVQRFGDLLRRQATGIIPKDSTNNVCLFRVDLPLAADHLAAGRELRLHAVAVSLAARGFALQCAALETAVGLHRDVLELERIHRPLEPDMDLGNQPFREGLDGEAVEAEFLVDVGDVGLIAAQPVEGFRDNHIEGAAARIAQQRLHAAAHQAGARGGAVGIGGNDLQPLGLGIVRAAADLVLYGSVALQVCRVAGVDGSSELGLGHGGSPVV